MAGGQEGPLALMARLSEGILAALRAPLVNLGNLMTMPPMQPMPVFAGPANGNRNNAPSAGTMGGMTVNITVNPAPGMDEKKLAELVTQKLRKH
ncbi:MAG: hypothetical protein LBO00_03425 [Zoogloeaceae bacterium]|jgi:hypothetical protein|nr:hypothetical protein [Zoogloeaceae bacterium]